MHRIKIRFKKMLINKTKILLYKIILIQILIIKNLQCNKLIKKIQQTILLNDMKTTKKLLINKYKKNFSNYLLKMTMQRLSLNYKKNIMILFKEN